MAYTKDTYKAWLLNLVKDLRNPEKGIKNTVIKDAEQRLREYEEAKAAAKKTGSAEDIAYAKQLKEVADLATGIIKSYDLKEKVSTLLKDFDANKNELAALKALEDSDPAEIAKLEALITKQRSSIKKLETYRNAYGPNPAKPGNVGYTGDQPAVRGSSAPTSGLVPGFTPPKTTYTPPKAGGTGTGGTGTGGTGTGGTRTGGNGTPTQTVAQREAAAENVMSAAEFGLSEALFKNVPSLKAIYDKYIDPKSGMTDDEFRKLIRNDNWYLKNSKEIKNRFVQLYNYKDLVASGQAQGTTDYEKQIADLERQLLTKARQMGSAVASDPAALRKAAENWYITNVDINDPLVGDFLAAQIKPTFSTLGGVGQEGYSGEALKNYQELQGIAKRNGFKITDILPGVRNEQQALQAIATGAIDLNRINQDARRLAAQGQTQYVRDLLGQGYDLEQIYAPYKQTMANVLEIDDPNSIDLNDATLRSAITDKGDMNIYDFKKALKADNRWQYTEGARNEVSDAAFKVLRDFGFQG